MLSQERHQTLAKQLWHMRTAGGFNATCEVCQAAAAPTFSFLIGKEEDHAQLMFPSYIRWRRPHRAAQSKTEARLLMPWSALSTPNTTNVATRATSVLSHSCSRHSVYLELKLNVSSTASRLLLAGGRWWTTLTCGLPIYKKT